MVDSELGELCKRVLCGVLLLGSACFSESDDAPSFGDSAAMTTDEASSGSTGETTGGAAPKGEIRAVHAAAGVGPVDIYVAGETSPRFEALRYADASEWVEVPVGSWVLEFRSAGAAADSVPVHTSAAVSVDDDDRVTAIALGRIDAEDPESAFRVLALLDDWGAPLAGRARARVVHASPDAPTFGVDGVEVDEPLARFGSSEAVGFALDAAGGQRLLLLEDAPTDPSTFTSFTTPPVGEGDEVLLIAAGNLDSVARESDALSVIAVGRDGALGVVRQDPQLFVLHGSRDADFLEVCTGDTELAANFTYGQLQSTRVSPGTYDVSIHNYPSGCGMPVFNTNSTGPLEAGERYLLLVTGEIVPENTGEAGIQVATFTDAFPLDVPQGARLRFVHGASFTQIYVGSVTRGSIAEENVYTEPIGWSVESAEVPLAPGDFLLGIADADASITPPYNPIVTIPYPAVGGARQWVIVAGDPLPEEADGGVDGGFLQALVVDTTTPQWSVAIVDVELPPT